MTRATTTGHRIPVTTGILSFLAAIVRLFTSRRRDRLNLSRLDPHLLRDIGLDPDRATQECAKPFWRA